MKKRTRPTPAQADDIRRVKKALLPLFPKRVRFNIEVWSGAGDDALCWLGSRGVWQIRLNASLDDGCFQDSLIHEFAHALAGGNWEREGAHGAVWGVCFAACYRSFIEGRSPQVNKRKK